MPVWQRSLSGIMPSSSNAQVSSSPIRVLVRARCGRAANSMSHDLGQRLSSITNERISASRIDKVSRMPTANAAIVSRPRSVFPASRQDSHSSNGSATQSALACCAPRSRRSLRNSCDLVFNSSKTKGSVCSAACRLACRFLRGLCGVLLFIMSSLTNGVQSIGVVVHAEPGSSRTEWVCPLWLKTPYDAGKNDHCGSSFKTLDFQRSCVLQTLWISY